MKKPLIGAARAVAEQFSARQAIVIVFGENAKGERTFAAVSYGENGELCEKVAATLNGIADGIRDGTIPTP